MRRFKKAPQIGHEGKIIYSDSIIDNIVKLAVMELDFVELDLNKSNDINNAIKVVLAKDGVHVDVRIKIHFSQSVSEIAFKVQESVRHNVEAMTEYKIASVNVKVNNVTFEETNTQEKIENEKSFA